MAAIVSVGYSDSWSGTENYLHSPDGSHLDGVGKQDESANAAAATIRDIHDRLKCPPASWYSPRTYTAPTECTFYQQPEDFVLEPW